MQAMLLSFGAGTLAGMVYGLLGVKSPTPPVIALVGLAGILLGEQALPAARRPRVSASVGATPLANRFISSLFE